MIYALVLLFSRICHNRIFCLSQRQNRPNPECILLEARTLEEIIRVLALKEFRNNELNTSPASEERWRMVHTHSTVRHLRSLISKRALASATSLSGCKRSETGADEHATREVSSGIGLGWAGKLRKLEPARAI